MYTAVLSGFLILESVYLLYLGYRNRNAEMKRRWAELEAIRAKYQHAKAEVEQRLDAIDKHIIVLRNEYTGANSPTRKAAQKAVHEVLDEFAVITKYLRSKL